MTGSEATKALYGGTGTAWGNTKAPAVQRLLWRMVHCLRRVVRHNCGGLDDDGALLFGALLDDPGKRQFGHRRPTLHPSAAGRPCNIRNPAKGNFRCN